MNAVIAVLRLDLSTFPTDLHALGNDDVRRRITERDADVAAQCDIRPRLPRGCAREGDETLRAVRRNRHRLCRSDLRAASQNDCGIVVNIDEIDTCRPCDLRLFHIGLSLRRGLAGELRRGLEGHVVRRIGERQCVAENIGSAHRLLYELAHLHDRVREFLCLFEPLLRHDVAGIIPAFITICRCLVTDCTHFVRVDPRIAAMGLDCIAALKQFADHLLNIRIAEMGIRLDVDRFPRDPGCVCRPRLLRRKRCDTRRVLDVHHVDSKAAHALRFLGLSRLDLPRLPVRREIPIGVRVVVDGALCLHTGSLHRAVCGDPDSAVRMDGGLRCEDDIRPLRLVDDVNRAAERDLLRQRIECSRRGKPVGGESDLLAELADISRDSMDDMRDAIRLQSRIRELR